MLAALVPLAAAASIAYVTDTTLTVTRPARLVLNSQGGDVTVRTWDRPAVRVQAEHEEDVWVDIGRKGRNVMVESHSERSEPNVDFRITVPPWIAVQIDGLNVEVATRGLDGAVAISTVNGSIDVRGGSGLLALESVQGEILVRDARGRIQAHAINGPIDLDRVEGVIVAETVNGEIMMRRVVSDSIAASTVNGALCFDGTLRDGGVYRLASHNGDIAVGVASGADARVSVSTYSGDFRSDFPVNTKNKQLKRFAFQIGQGGALLHLESFQGRIRLRRPGLLWKEGEPPCAEDEDNDNDNDNENVHEHSREP